MEGIPVSRMITHVHGVEDVVREGDLAVLAHRGPAPRRLELDSIQILPLSTVIVVIVTKVKGLSLLCLSLVTKCFPFPLSPLQLLSFNFPTHHRLPEVKWGLMRMSVVVVILDHSDISC